MWNALKTSKIYLILISFFFVVVEKGGDISDSLEKEGTHGGGDGILDDNVDVIGERGYKHNWNVEIEAEENK